MSLITTLRATNCYALDTVGKGVVAYGPRTLYSYSLDGSRNDSLPIPKEAVWYACWMPLGSSVCDVVYIDDQNDLYHKTWEDTAESSSFTRRKTGLSDEVKGLRVVGGHYLILYSSLTIFLYDLMVLKEDDVNEVLTPLAKCELPPHKDIEFFPSTDSDRVAVVLFSADKVHLLVWTLSSTPQVALRSPPSGVSLPSSSVSAAVRVSSAVLWSQPSLLVLLRRERQSELVELSFHNFQWDAAKGVKSSDSWGSTLALLPGGCNTVWCAEGGESGSVSIRNIFTNDGVPLNGSSASAKVCSTPVEGGALVVMVGKSLYRVDPPKKSTFSSWMSAVTVKPKDTESVAVVEHVLGRTSGDLPFIPRDTQYVHQESDDSLRHCVLDKIMKDPKATVHYIALAHSFHPYTTLRVFVDADPSLCLALASLLCQKVTLKGGHFTKQLKNAVAPFCHTHLPTGIRVYSYVHALSEGAVSGVVVGALKATAFLCALVDVILSYQFLSGDLSSTVSISEAEKELEAHLLTNVSFLSSFTDWSLTCGSKIGTISAHIGTPSALKKEAMLNDGQSHVIETSRKVEIKPLTIDRPTSRVH